MNEGIRFKPCPCCGELVRWLDMDGPVDSKLDCKLGDYVKEVFVLFNCPCERHFDNCVRVVVDDANDIKGANQKHFHNAVTHLAGLWNNYVDGCHAAKLRGDMLAGINDAPSAGSKGARL